MSMNKHIRENFDGILAIGDVHGNEEAFGKAIKFAQVNNKFLISLGDLVDYGTQNYLCTQMMYDLVKDKMGLMVIGNHDFKFHKFLKQRKEGEIKVKVKGGLVPTVEEFEGLEEDSKENWHQTFMNLMDESKFHYVFDNLMFVHAGATPDMFKTTELNKKQRSRALFGQLDPEQPFNPETNYPNRIYDWVHDLNFGRIVVFGHDVLSKEKPVVMHARHGLGMGISVDTGSSKGGKLSGFMFEAYENPTYHGPDTKRGFWEPGEHVSFE